MMLQQTSNETNIKLPFSFILFSLIAFVGSQFSIFFSGTEMIQGIFRIPSLWTAAHLLVLGWALMAAMGAMYQLVPVAFLTPIWSERFGFVQFWVSAIGITGFAFSLSFFQSLMIYTGMLAVAGIVLFIAQMLMTIKKQAKWNIMTLFVGSALVCLLITIFLGITMTINMGIGIKGFNHLVILKSHIVLGLMGWFTFLVFGFSYKMVPMFSLSHGFSMSLAKWVYGAYVSGLAITIASFIVWHSILFQIGLVFLFLGFSIFTYHIYTILKVRLKKKLDRPFIFSICAIGFGLLIHLAAIVISFFPTDYHYFGILGYLYIFCWIIFSITGYLYKIVPFLWWTHRYSKQIGRTDVPTLKQMIDEKMCVPIFIGFIIGVAGIGLSVAFESQFLFYISQSIVFSASVLFSFTILNVLRK